MGREFKVSVERLDDTPMGAWSGGLMFHTMECASCPEERFVLRGCPLGRGSTEYESICDFVGRTNRESGLDIRVSEVVVVKRANRATRYDAAEATYEAERAAAEREASEAELWQAAAEREAACA